MRSVKQVHRVVVPSIAAVSLVVSLVVSPVTAAADDVEQVGALGVSAAASASEPGQPDGATNQRTSVMLEQTASGASPDVMSVISFNHGREAVVPLGPAAQSRILGLPDRLPGIASPGWIAPMGAETMTGVASTSGDWTVVIGLTERGSDESDWRAPRSFTASATYLGGQAPGGYRLWILDTTTGDIPVDSCEVQGPCETWPNVPDPVAQHRIVARVASQDDPEEDIQVEAVLDAWYDRPWWIDLSNITGDARPGQPVTLEAVAHMSDYEDPIAASEGSVALYIEDLTTGEILARCEVSTCTTELSFVTEPFHTVVAFVADAKDPRLHPEVWSYRQTVVRASWFSMVAQIGPPSRTVPMMALALYDVGLTDGHYANYLIDATTDRVVKKCVTGMECIAEVPAASSHAYIAVVASSGNPHEDVLSVSSGALLAQGPAPLYPGEVNGGSNLASDCSQRCHGDPVNSITGEFWESTVDLRVSEDLAATRSYGTSFADSEGALGYGWTSSWGMRLEVAHDLGPQPLSEAGQIVVVQENGSRVPFTRINESLRTPDRFRATLTESGDGGYEYVRDGQEVFRFDESGRLTSMQDSNGNTVSLQYAENRLTRASDDRGRFIDVSWTGERITALTDHTGRAVAYTYSTEGDLVRVDLPDGAATGYTYDAGHRIVDITHPDGGVTHNEYDAADRVVEQTDPLGRAITFAYDAGQTVVTDPSGSVTIERHVDGQLVSETTAVGTELEATTLYGYGWFNNQVESITDSLGRVTAFTYDGRGNRTSITDASGRTSMMTYDQWSNPLTIANPAGETTTFTYDDRGNPLTATAPDGATTTFTVNPDGTVATSTDATGRTTSYTYDARGFVATATGPDGATIVTSYDSLGRLVSTTDPRGLVTGGTPADYTSTFTYDPVGRVLTTTDAVGAVVSTASY